MREVAHALEAQRSATLVQLGGLADPAWDGPCLPPWRVREVVAHLIAVDAAAVTGRLLPVLRTHGRAEVERWNDEAVAELAGCRPAELLALLERWGARLKGFVARLPRPLRGARFRTAFGRQPVHVLVCRRIVDEWVHTHDIARVSDGRVALPPGVPGALATGVLETLPALVLPRTDLRAGVVRFVVETGIPDDPHGPRRTWGVDFARRHYGPRVTAAPDAVLRLHATTLALLAEGRPSGCDVMVTGDEALARRVLAQLGP